MDLEAFAMSEADERNKKSKCQTCNLDDTVLKQIHDGRRRLPKPVPYPTISKWLEKEHGIKIQQATIRNHFVAGHVDE